MYLEHGFREQCTFHDLYYDNYRDDGLCSKLKFVCNHCPYFKWINLVDNNGSSMPVNDGAVSGTIRAGTGYSELKQELASMGLKFMSNVTYREHRQKLVATFEKTAQECMEEAAAMERELAIMKGETINGIPYITVQVDGSWLKRSYRSGKFDSLSGCAAIIGCRTKKVLYVGVRNKLCHVCDLDERKNRAPAKHKCYKNWGRDQSSSAMEKDIVVQGFLESVEKHKLIYKTVIGDGDSSVYKSILDSNPYRQYGIRVEKVECTNHLLRNMCNKIVDASKGRLAHNLVRGNVKTFREYVKKCSFKIRQHVMTLIKIIRNEKDGYSQVKMLQNQIINSVHHVFGDHSQCRKFEVPCENQSFKNWIPILKSTGMYSAIRQAVSNLSCHALSLLKCATSNHVESFNAIVAKIVGSKRINFGQRDSYYVRVHAAVVQYNTQSLLTRLHENYGYDPPSAVTLMEMKAQNHIQQKKTLRMLQGRRRKRYVESGKEDYGEGANRPDVSPEAYEILVQQHLEKLKKDQANRVEIERSTVNQSNCDSWYQKRSELLTPSNFGRICRRRTTTSCASIVKNMLYPPVLNLPALTYGIENEANSRIRLSKKLKKNIELAGLMIDPNDEYLGASVDGLIGNDGIVELKNPISIANLTISQGLKRKRNIRNIFSKEDVNQMNTAHQYYYQVQGQLHVSNRQYCIFAVCTKIDIKYIRVERDDDFWDKNMADQLRRFYFDCLLPELLDSRYNRNMAIREPEYVLEAQKEKQGKVTAKTANVSKKKEKLKTVQKENTKRKRKAANLIEETATNQTVTLQSRKKNPKRFKITATNVSNDICSGMEYCTEEHENNSSEFINIDTSAAEIEEQRNVLATLYININMDNVYNNILDIRSRLNDDSIEAFLQLAKKEAPQYEIHPIIYFRFYHLLPQEFVGYHGKIHVQIIGGHPDYEHWILIRYDGKYLQIFDSINRTNTSDLQPAERDYLNYRYPQLEWENVRFAKVTQQPDAVTCGVYSFAYMTDVILKKNVMNIKYSINSTVMRNHAVTVLRHQKLQRFPYRR
ncbi:hypothetical protein TSAR_011565 [Trichomalopsis sarcophagae]|uniref:Uncharacterized protein n=1 Tax=Trichomalopsis sarcophagae TaxID=543379 RepID=A0A232ESK7_9HYME|nr:hypothetical protein TSAR_011565 [Trichomalopsis sarcophagae]